jgi:hypothetical protein
MIFNHICKYIPTRFHDVEQTPRLKPDGLWLSLPGGWKSWSMDDNATWVCTVDLEDGMFSAFPWTSKETDKIIKIDMSSIHQLDGFIDRYRCDGYQYEIDWPKVQRDFGGVYFQNVESMPRSNYAKYRKVCVHMELAVHRFI